MNDAAVGNKLEKILQLMHKIVGHLDKPKPDKANVPADAVAEPQRRKLSPGDIVQIVTAVLLLLTLGVSILTFIWSVKSNQRQFKAFVYVSLIGIGGGANNGQNVTFIRVENSGDTPARRVKVTNIQFLFLPNIAHYYDLLTIPSNEPDSDIGLLPPKLSNTTYLTMTPLQLDSVRKSINVEVVTGQIEYADVFGKSHFTKFCESVQGSIDKTEDHPETFVFRNCNFRNCDDEDCPVTEVSN